MCSAHEILSQRPCWVFSLGSHGQTDFEEAVRGRYPHCNIHVYDPTISVEVAGRVADMTQVLARSQHCMRSSLCDCKGRAQLLFYWCLFYARIVECASYERLYSALHLQSRWSFPPRRGAHAAAA